MVKKKNSKKPTKVTMEAIGKVIDSKLGSFAGRVIDRIELMETVLRQALDRRDAAKA